MNTKSTFLLPTAAAAVAFALALAGCPEPPPVITDPPPELASCDTSDECAAQQPGTVCANGICVSGECDTLLQQDCRQGQLDSEFCCKPWEQCNAFNNNCELDPSVQGIGCQPDDVDCTPCESDDDCRGGQFCSGATCLDAAGRDDCVTSFDCADGQRCDRTEFLCVPDRGACQFCGEFPELCCEDDQACSTQTGFCLDIEDPECDTGADCGDGEPLCNDDTKQCVECIVDGDCGPNLLCDPGAGTCFSEFLFCTVDEDCNGNQRCATAIEQCVLPQCESDTQCANDPDFDDRFECDEGVFRCILPAPVCSADPLEPNNSSSEASPLIDDNHIDSLLCRGDVDFFSFPVIENRRYTVTVDFSGSGQPGIIVTLLGTTGVVESTATFEAFDSRVQVVGVTAPGESGTFHLKIQGNNTDNDEWSHSVTVAEDEPSIPADCTPAGQAEEPNDTFADATQLTLGVARTFSRCGFDDVDFYRVSVPDLNGVTALMDAFANAEGNMNIELFKAPQASARIDSGVGVNDLEEVAGPEGSTEYFLKVFLASTTGALQDQTYRLNTGSVARPAACIPDPTENDGTFAGAAPLTLVPDAVTTLPGVTVTDIIRCNPQDIDNFRFSMPPNLGGVVRLRFTHSEGDIKLELRDAVDGTTLLDSSNVSSTTSEIDEQVEIPGSATQTIDYTIRVLLNGTSGGTIGQRYSLEIVTFDNSQCIASEPDGGDEIFDNGRCIGDWTPLTVTGGANPCTNEGARIPEPMETATLATCAGAPEGTIAGCGRICGNDDADWYRVGPVVDDAVIHAVLNYNILEGELSLVRGTLNNNGTVTETATADANDDGTIEFSFATPRGAANLKEYGVRVKTVGNTGHQVQPYALRIELGPSCFDDPNDTGTAGNETPAAATIIRDNPDDSAPFIFDSATAFAQPSSRCTSDVDVYEFLAFQGEQVDVELNQVDASPSGMVFELGTRPANLTQPAVLVTGGAGVAGGDPVSYTSVETEQLYVTVKVPTGVVVTGPYTLTITTTPPP